MIENTTQGLALTFKRDRILILALCVVGAVGMCVYTYAMKPKFRASETLLLPIEDTAALGLASVTGNGPSPLDILKSVVESSQTSQELGKRFHMDQRDVDKALEVTEDNTANNLTITATMHTQKEAEAMVNAAYDILARTSSQLSLSRSAEQAKFYKQTMDDIQNELPAKEKDALEYVKSMKTASDPTDKLPGAEYVEAAKQLDLQLEDMDKRIDLARSATTGAAKQGMALPTGIPGIEPLRDQLVQEEVQLKIAETTEGPDNPDIVARKKSIEVADQAIASEIKKFIQSVKGNANKDIADLIAQRTLLKFEDDKANALAKIAPTEGLGLLNKVNEATIAATVLAGIRQQYEISRVSAETEKVRWSILDPTHLEEYGEPTNKHYGRSAFGGVALGLFVGLGFGAIRRRKDQPLPRES